RPPITTLFPYTPLFRSYLESWIQAAVALQTQENLDAALAELEPLRTAADKQHISRLDLLDLEVELGRLTAELSETLRQAHAANRSEEHTSELQSRETLV